MKSYNSRDIHAWFGQYTRQFLLANMGEQYPVILKINHCQRVRKEAVALGKILSLDLRDLCIVETAGLLHDIGRFEQFNRYKTFADSVSVNHAELGVDVLRQNDVLQKFPETDKSQIIKAVLYHNRGVLPAEEDDKVLLLTRIIRDADKLDIWRVFFNHTKLSKDKQHGAVDLNLPDSHTFSEHVIADLLAEKIVDYRNVKTKSDFALMRLGWVYDINFTHTFKEILKRDYLPQLKRSLPQDEKIDTAFEAAHVFVVNKASY